MRKFFAWLFLGKRLPRRLRRTLAVLYTPALIAADNFHEYRAALYARQNGLTPFSIGCRSPWFLAGGCWCRETAAIVAAYIL